MNRLAVLPPLLPLLLLGGCAVGPQYHRPPLDVPESFRGQDAVPASASLGDLGWHDMYREPGLDELLRIALENNRDVLIAAARIEQARAQVGVARLGQLPQIDVGAGGQRGRTLQGGKYATGNIFSASLEVSYEVDLWRRLASLSDAARASLLASEYARRGVQVSLVAAVATAYFTLVALDEQVRVAERTAATRQRFLDLTQSKFRRGVSSGLELSRAEATLAQARASIPDLRRQIEQTENQLQILLGRNPGDIAREHIELESMAPAPEVPAGLPSSLLERRPDLRQAEANLEGATANTRAAKAALFPTIALTGAFGTESFELSQLFSAPTRIWTVGLSLLQPILNAQRNGYQLEAAQARQQEAMLQYQQAVQQAFREVADALAARRGFADLQSEQEKQVKALREASRRVLRRYEVGYSSYFEVIDADSSLFSAELVLIQAYRDNRVALVLLYKALGGGWQDAQPVAPAGPMPEAPGRSASP